MSQENNTKLIIIDLFCGFGGVTHAMQQCPTAKVIAAVNHDPAAIDCHKQNHPEVVQCSGTRCCSNNKRNNVFGLCEGRASEYQSFNLAQCLIVLQMFNKPLMPCFCKTLVMGSTVFNTRF